MATRTSRPPKGLASQVQAATALAVAAAGDPRRSMGLFEVQLIELRPFVRTVSVAASTPEGACAAAENKKEWLSQTELTPLPDDTPTMFGSATDMVAVRERDVPHDDMLFSDNVEADESPTVRTAMDTHYVTRVGDVTIVVQ